LPLRRIIFADDATGALEAGALAGSGAIVRLHGELDEASAIQVVLAPTRHVSETDAYAMTVRAVTRLPFSDSAIYWKTDSTLRGQIGACFRALLTCFPERRIVYCPAYPALQRTVRDGVLYVAGVPVHETAFGKDPRNPVRSSVVREALGLPESEHRLVICDAETEAAVAKVFEDPAHAGALFAGPAGGIRYWMRDGGARQSARRLPAMPADWLVVCGSQHPMSLLQAKQAGSMPVLFTEDGNLDALAQRAVQAGASAMIVFGGDTALALWNALGITELRPFGEVLPGVVVSVSADEQRIFVTKAGGFGGPWLVAEILERWETFS
jgi:D-threonate/D-erythronate kinase